MMRVWLMYVNTLITLIPVMTGSTVRCLISVSVEYVVAQRGTAQRRGISVITGYVMKVLINV